MAVAAPAVVDLTSDEFALELQHEELLRQQTLARDEAYAQQLAVGLEEAFDDEVTLAEQRALAESIAEVASARDAPRQVEREFVFCGKDVEFAQF